MLCAHIAFRGAPQPQGDSEHWLQVRAQAQQPTVPARAKLPACQTLCSVLAGDSWELIRSRDSSKQIPGCHLRRSCLRWLWTVWALSPAGRSLSTHILLTGHTMLWGPPVFLTRPYAGRGLTCLLFNLSPSFHTSCHRHSITICQKNEMYSKDAMRSALKIFSLGVCFAFISQAI